MWQKASEMRHKGVPAEEAAAQIDMRSHAGHFPAIKEIGVNPNTL